MTDKDIRRLCFDSPVFRQAYNQFSDKSSKSEIIDELLEFCDTKSLFDELLAEVKAITPKKYDLFVNEHTVSENSMDVFVGEKNKISILFLSADPTNASRLRLGEEFREIQEKLRSAKLREYFKLELPQLSARPIDIVQALLDTHPQFVHFSGHGTRDGVLCFENIKGESQPVQLSTLSELFEQFSTNIRCVILNACYSETQAIAIAQHINYVIGMTQEINDRAAIAFTVGFYQSLGAGKTVEESFKFGCLQIKLQGISGDLIPVLIKKQARDMS